jgi:2-oxoglutarate dehydrogenase E1 component
MYEKIRSHPRVREIWAKRLEEEQVVSRDEAEAMVRAQMERLTTAKNTPPTESAVPVASPLDESAEGVAVPPVPSETLVRLNEELLQVRPGFTADQKLARLFLNPRREKIQEANGIVWAHAESLAFATLLEEGIPIRLTGQDSERGTFTQRHLVLHDPTTGERYCPLQHLPNAKAAFGLYNSPLSETAALGFEYGYSIHATDTLVLWEAQFGDFSNGAQVIIDQFIASGNAKWAQSPSVVLLLPHGYEGQGPEHSSARIERFLQLCAGDNLRVANCTSSAQYYHLLRRHAHQLESTPRPLVIFTPKSLLRHPRASSSLRDLAEGTFHSVLDDPRDPARKEKVTRLVLCSGKVYIDLVYGAAPQFELRDEYLNSDFVAVARLEELNPFPTEELQALLATYPNLVEIVWVQEEPRNMGAWIFVQPRLVRILPPAFPVYYLGRPRAASPAEGTAHLHLMEQKRIITMAFSQPKVAEKVAEEATPLVPANGKASKRKTNGTGSTDAEKTKVKRTEAETHVR